jgi:hypothetical protein
MEEESLRRAVFVTIIGSRPPVSLELLQSAVAKRFGLDMANIAFHRTDPEDFLLLLPDAATTERLRNGGEPVRTPRFCCLIKPW